MSTIGRSLPPGVSPITIELTLKDRKNDNPSAAISAIQVKHDATVSLKLPLPDPRRYTSEAFLLLQPSVTPGPGYHGDKLPNGVSHDALPTAERAIQPDLSHDANPISEEQIRPVLISNESILPELLDNTNLFKEVPRLEENLTESERYGESSTKVNDKRKEDNNLQGHYKHGEINSETKKNGQPCGNEFLQSQVDRTLENNLNNNAAEHKGDQKQGTPHQVTRERGFPLRGHTDLCCLSRTDNDSTQVRSNVVDEAEGSSFEDLLMSFDEDKEAQNTSSDSGTIQSSVLFEDSAESLESDINPLWVLDSITVSASTSRTTNDRLGEDQAVCDEDSKEELTEENIEKLYLQQNGDVQGAKIIGNSHCLLRRKLSTIEEEAKRLSLCSDDTGSLSHSRVLEETAESIDTVKDVSRTESVSSMTVDEGFRPLSQSSDDVESFSQFRLFGPPVDASSIKNSNNITAASLTSSDEESKRSSQSSDDMGSLGFGQQYEDDMNSYIEGEEYFKNLPTFHQLLTSAETKDVSESKKAPCDNRHSQVDSQFGSMSEIHEQTDFSCDMVDVNAVSSEYWDYPFPSRGDANGAAASSEDHVGVLESMRMRVRDRFRHLANSSSDSGCQDDVANSSFDDPEMQDDGNDAEGGIGERQKESDAHNPEAKRSDDKVGVTSEAELLASRRKILENVQRILDSTERSPCSQMNEKKEIPPCINNNPWDTDVNENDQYNLVSTPVVPFPLDDTCCNGNAVNLLNLSCEPEKEYANSKESNLRKEDNLSERILNQPTPLTLQGADSTKSSRTRSSTADKDVSSSQLNNESVLDMDKLKVDGDIDLDLLDAEIQAVTRKLLSIDSLATTSTAAQVSVNETKITKDQHRFENSSQPVPTKESPITRKVEGDKNSTSSEKDVQSADSKIKRTFKSDQGHSPNGDSVTEKSTHDQSGQIPVTGDEEIDIDLNDSRVQEVTKKMQGFFRNRKTSTHQARTQSHTISGAPGAKGPIRGVGGGLSQSSPINCDVNIGGVGTFQCNGGDGRKSGAMLTKEGLINASAPASSINAADSSIVPTKLESQLCRHTNNTIKLSLVGDHDHDCDVGTSKTIHETMDNHSNPTQLEQSSILTGSLARRPDDGDHDCQQPESMTSLRAMRSNFALLDLSDDTEYETARSDVSENFSFRLEDDLERTPIAKDCFQTFSPLRHRAPRFLIRPRDVSCRAGDRARFVCCVSGFPCPNINWFALGRAVNLITDTRLRVTDYFPFHVSGEPRDGDDIRPLVTILDIDDPRAAADIGRYTCVATNDIGRASFSAHLNIISEDEIPSLENSIKENGNKIMWGRNADVSADGCSALTPCPADLDWSLSSLPPHPPLHIIHALVGSKASFFCPVQDDETVAVSWIKDGKQIGADGRYLFKIEGCIHCLEIRDVTISDAGNYSCERHEDARETVLCLYNLKVREPAQDDIVTPHRLSKELGSPGSSNQVKGCEQGSPSEEIPVQSAIELSAERPLTSSPNGDDISMGDQRELSRRKTGTDIDNEKRVTFLTNASPSGIAGSDKKSVDSKDGLLGQDRISSDSCCSAEGPRYNPEIDIDHLKMEDPKVTTASEEGNESDIRLEKSPKRKTSRRNVKASHKQSSRNSLGFNDNADDTLPDYRKKPLTRTNSYPSARKKRHSNKKRKPKEEERVQLGINKAEELTVKVDTCLDIINDLLTLTSYNKNESETEESLLIKIDNLIQKFTDSESDVSSSLSKNHSHYSRRKGANMGSTALSDSNAESQNELSLGSKHSVKDVEANGLGPKNEGETNGWGQCSLEDSLKVMSELVVNIKGSVLEQKRKPRYSNKSSPTKDIEDEGLNVNDNNNNWRGTSLEETLRRRPANLTQIKRTPLMELLKQSLFSPELMSTQSRQTRISVTKSLESGGESSGSLKPHIKRKRRNSIGSPYSKNPLNGSLGLPSRRTRVTRNRSFVPPTDSSSCDESYALERDQLALQSLIAQSMQSELQTSEVDDKCQQFPEGDSNLSPLCFLASASESDEHERCPSEEDRNRNTNCSLITDIVT